MKKNNIKISYSDEQDVFELEKRKSLDNILSCCNNSNKINYIYEIKNYYNSLRDIEKKFYKVIFIWLLIVLFVWFSFFLFKIVYIY